MVFWQSMGKVYKDQGDEKYAREWNKQLIDWVIKIQETIGINWLGGL